jgi:hypothetical protein
MSWTRLLVAADRAAHLVLLKSISQLCKSFVESLNQTLIIMATLIQEQIEQKKKLLEEKAKEMKVIYDELVEAGAIDLSDDELDAVAGGRMGWGKIADETDDYGNRF